MDGKPDFETLVEAHSAELFAYLWRLLSEPSEAEDCLQETLLRAFRAYPRTQNHGKFRAWLYRIATNTAYTHLNRRARQTARTVELDHQAVSPALPIPDQVQRSLSLAEVRQAVEALPEKQRAALLMRKYQQLSYPEIAAALGCREQTARAHVYQGLKKLRARFAPPTDKEIP